LILVPFWALFGSKISKNEFSEAESQAIVDVHCLTQFSPNKQTCLSSSMLITLHNNQHLGFGPAGWVLIALSVCFHHHLQPRNMSPRTNRLHNATDRVLAHWCNICDSTAYSLRNALRPERAQKQGSIESVLVMSPNLLATLKIRFEQCD
jgi:hypothetical protein